MRCAERRRRPPGRQTDIRTATSYFVTDVTPDKPLKVRYRVWVQPGEMTGEQCAALSKAFVDPPKVTAGK